MRHALDRLVLLAVLANLLGASLAWAQSADIAVSKDGPAVAAAGSEVTYTVTVTNNGPDSVGAGTGPITLTDAIPGGMTFVSASPPGCSTPAVGSGGSIVCTISSLSPMTSVVFTFVFNIPSGTAPGTVFTNVATATLPDRIDPELGLVNPDPNPENNSASVVTTVPGASPADVGVGKTGPAAARPDTDVVYTIVVVNSGPDAASSLVLNDPLPGTMTFVSLSQTGTPLTCAPLSPGAGGTLNCTAAIYAAGGSTTLTLTVHVPSGTPSGTVFTNTATVSSTTADPTSENNSSLTSLTVSNVDVSVTKSGPATVNVGDTITYTIHVANAGGETAANVQLADPLPPNTTFVSLTQNTGPVASCSTPPHGGTGTVTCMIGALASGASADFTLVVRPGDTGSITNTVTVASDSEDADPANNTASATTTVNSGTPVNSADVSVTDSGPATATPGSNVTYTVTVSNAGPSTAAAAHTAGRAIAPAATVTLTINLSPNTTFVSLTQTAGPTFACVPPAVGATGTITCTIATLAPGASATFAIVVNISLGAAGQITSTATVTATTPDPNPNNNASTVVIALETALSIPALSPSSFALLGLGLALAGFWVLRRRRPAPTR